MNLTGKNIITIGQFKIINEKNDTSIDRKQLKQFPASKIGARC